MIWSEYYYCIFSLNTKVHLTITLSCTFKVRYFCCYLDIGSKETSTQKSASITQVFAGQKKQVQLHQVFASCTDLFYILKLNYIYLLLCEQDRLPRFSKQIQTHSCLLAPKLVIPTEKKSCMKDLLTATLQVPKHTRDNPLLQLHSLKSLLSSFSTLSVQRCF